MVVKHYGSRLNSSYGLDYFIITYSVLHLVTEDSHELLCVCFTSVLWSNCVRSRQQFRYVTRGVVVCSSYGSTRIRVRDHRSYSMYICTYCTFATTV
jgi:hypothetical protein